MKQVILASASPRRRELLGQLFADFIVIPSGAEEHTDKTQPYEIVCEIAKQKAEWVALRYPDALVIGADTMVFSGNAALGKPRDRADARRMLKMLSGRTHQVYTGVAVIADGKSIARAEKTDVTFAPLSDAEIDAYLATGDSMDKAGAYGIQGYAARFIERINGCYFNVVGLPVHRVYEMVRGVGL